MPHCRSCRLFASMFIPTSRLIRAVQRAWFTCPQHMVLTDWNLKLQLQTSAVPLPPSIFQFICMWLPVVFRLQQHQAHPPCLGDDDDRREHECEEIRRWMGWGMGHCGADSGTETHEDLRISFFFLFYMLLVCGSHIDTCCIRRLCGHCICLHPSSYPSATETQQGLPLSLSWHR